MPKLGKRKWSYVDRPNGADPRVRWTNRETRRTHAKTFLSDVEARKFQDYLDHWEACVSPGDDAVVSGQYRIDVTIPPRPTAMVVKEETFGEFAERHIRFKSRRMTDDSQDANRERLNRTKFLTEAGRSLYDTPVKDVDLDLIIDFEEALKKALWGKPVPTKPYSPLTIRTTMQFVVEVIKVAMIKSLLPLDTLYGYDVPAGRRRAAERGMRQDQYLAIRKHGRTEEIRLMIEFLALTGCRLGEMIAFQSTHLVAVEGVAGVAIYEQERNRHRSRPKNKEPRMVLIGPDFAARLREFILKTGRRGLVFRSPMYPEQAWSHGGFSYQFKQAVEKAVEAGDLAWLEPDLLPTPHYLRHAYVQWARSSDEQVPVEAVAAQTGHSKSELMKTYSNVSPEALARLVRHVTGLTSAASD
jgi:integrase